MKKIFAISLISVLAISTSFAQDAAWKAAQDAAAALAAAPVEETPAPKPNYWKRSVAFSLGVNNTLLDNWAAGGYNTTTLSSSFDAKADYKKDLMSWNNRLQLDYGFLNSSDKEGVLQKNNDRIYLESKWAYQTGSNSKLSYTAGFDFRSQFTDTPSGYTQDPTSGEWLAGEAVSGLLSPAYTNIALGLQWVPSSWCNINVAPLTGGFTIVTKEALRSRYGMKPLTFDAENNPLTYKNALFQFGAQVKANFKFSINDKLTLESQAVVFTDYLSEPYFRINWDNAIDWQLSRLIKLSFKTWMINDPNITVTDESGNVSPRGWQFKEFMSFAFTYTIANK